MAATTALVLALAFAVLTFGVRTAAQLRRTGDNGWRVGVRDSTTAVSHVALIGGIVVLLAGLVLAVTDAGLALVWDPPVPALFGVLGLACTLAGGGLCFASQMDMGESWRIGVDPDERTALVTDGLYRWVRNPIYTGMLLLLVGMVLLVPSAWTVAALLLVLVGLEVQTRRVEEPFLQATHGEDYRWWANKVGRFVPGVGRLAA